MRGLLGTVAVLAAHVAFAQGAVGVSDERVTLPGAPGSLDGMGSNAISEGNQGALTYKVDVEAIPGFPGLTPEVAFSYSSNAGSTVLGLGWSMPKLSIERRTMEGLQKYAPTDTFVVDGSEQLVLVGQDATSMTYRKRFESDFVRYTWKTPGTGENGYWTAELPDGRIATYGADSSGTPVTTAQVIVPATAPAKVFRWHMVSMVDRYGHEMRLSWTKNAFGFPLLDRVDYVFDNGMPRHSMRFTYETRGDLVSDARPGFELLLDQRLKQVTIISGTEVVRAYTLVYESDTASGGQSRLQTVSRFGRGNVQYPVTFSFAYTQTLGAECTTGSCDKPFVVDMGTLGGVDFSTGKATLIDINGDALPDVLFSDSTGHHSFYYAKLDSDGHASFSMTPVFSTKTAQGSAFLIGDPKTQLLDLDGDGFVDIAQATTESVFCNKGTGDWVDASQCTGANINLPASAMNDDPDPTQADPHNVRFFDYDNDRRIDWLRTFSMAAGTEVLANTPTGFVNVPVDNIGATFDEDPLELADMNGDGLQDPVQLVIAGNVVQARFRLNLGRGSWAPWDMISLSGLDTTQASVAQVDDINGDGLSDIVAVTGTEVRIALNRNGDRFDAVRVLTSADLAAGSNLPARTTGTTVLFADMNGNGSDDIVWIETNGHVQYLELFPVRPNLLTRIENGLGAVQVITYGSSIAEQARDATPAPWKYRLPHAAIVVKQVVSYVTLTGSDTGGLREITSKSYHSGFYDGVEKQFRGYETVEEMLSADMSRDAQEPGVITTQYDLGRTDPLFAGTTVSRITASTATGQSVVLLDERWLHDACPVAQVPVGTTPPIHFLCERAATKVHVERDPAHAVTTRVEQDWDGYGNVVAKRDLGVVNLGTPEAPMACAACTSSGHFGAPCGMTCDGDEWLTQNEYVVPGTDTSGAWFPHSIKRTASAAATGVTGDEVLTYYDGPDFDGLPSGQLTKGGVTRVMVRRGPNPADFKPRSRFKRDAHGNIAVSLPARAMVSGSADGRTVNTFEPAGLNPLRSELMLNGPGGMTALRKDYAWDTAWEHVAQTSDWYPEAGTNPLGTPQVTADRYDEHGRVLRQVSPGETDANASLELSYQLAAPASKVSSLERSSAAGPQDLVDVSCFDGKGRLFQKRMRLTDTRWQVTGFTEFDARGRVARQYQPYLASTGDCEMAPPSGVLFSSFKFDVLQRPMQTTLPDGAVRRTEYLPLVQRVWDENDTDATQTFTATPTVRTYDGLGRLVAFSRLSQALGTGTPATARAELDAHGNVAAVYDPLGNAHTQIFDFDRKLTQVTDPNRGTTHYDYDDDLNPVRRTDARGTKTHTVFDVLDRPIERYDEADEAGTRVDWSYDLVTDCTECTNGGYKPVELKWGGPLAGSTRLGYDAKQRAIYFERHVGDVTLVTRQRYDDANRLSSVTWPGGLSMDTAYDGDDRVTRLSGVVSAVEYDDRGDTKKVGFVNGAVTQYGYDARQRLTAINTAAKDNTTLLDLAYTWNPRGDLLKVTDGTRAGRARHAGAFTYDAYGRLTAAALGRDGPDETLTLAFDELDNLTSKTSSLNAQSPANLGAYTYDATRKNAVTAAGPLTFEYDAAGAMTRRAGVALTRDFDERIVAAPGATYAYAGPDRMAKQEEGSTTLYLGPDFEVRDGIASAYARLGHHRVGRMQTDALAALLYSDLAPATGSGAQLTVMGDGVIDVGDAWLAQAAGLAIKHLSGGPTPSDVGALLHSAARRLLMTDVVTLHGDHLGSIVLATDSSGALRGEQSFYPTGEPRSQQGFVDAHGFTGAELDPATQLLHFQHRELDPFVGRWEKPDPAFERLGPESLLKDGEATTDYAYVRNTLMNATDPTGLMVPQKSNGGGTGGNGGSSKGKDASNAGGNHPGGSGFDMHASDVSSVTAHAGPVAAPFPNQALNANAHSTGTRVMIQNKGQGAAVVGHEQGHLAVGVNGGGNNLVAQVAQANARHVGTETAIHHTGGGLQIVTEALALHKVQPRGPRASQQR